MTIPLTRGKFAIVDASDYLLVGTYSWHTTDRGYAAASMTINGRRVSVRMHRFIMGLKNGDHRILDHINGNRLDNRKINLRFCDKSQNAMNRLLQSNNTTGFKGVVRVKKTGRYAAAIYRERKRKNLGTFGTPEEAYAAYCKAADELHGQFANYGINYGKESSGENS